MKKYSLIFTLLFALFFILSGCNSSNQKLAKEMINKYSDNQNYIILSGEIVDYDSSNNTLEIKSESLNEYISYEDKICDFQIHSNQKFNLTVGQQINFTTVPFHFYNGHKLPIVELSVNNYTLLDFDTGKNNLIEWVKKNFK